VNGKSIVKNGQIDEDALNEYKATFRGWNYIGAGMVTAWLYLFFLLVLGFGYSYFWSASTIIYLLMRRKVDDTDLDEVYLEEDEAEESYTAGTTVTSSSPAPTSAPAGGGTLQMVEAPTLRTVTPPVTPPTPEPAPASAEVTTPPASDGNPAGEGANS
jgi:hypothetical protein